LIRDGFSGAGSFSVACEDAPDSPHNGFLQTPNQPPLLRHPVPYMAIMNKHRATMLPELKPFNFDKEINK
jgi:hypothetical protein